MRLFFPKYTLVHLVLGYASASAATVHGIVTDGNNQPFVKARVELVQPFRAGNPITAATSTDSGGYYEFNVVSPGRYQLFASKPKEGYGDPLGSFFAAGHPVAPYFTLKDENEILGINIDVGQPDGILTGDIRDQESEQPLPQASIRMVILDDASKFVQFGPMRKVRSRRQCRLCP